MRELATRDGTCSLPTSPPRSAPEEWSHQLADRNLDHAPGDSSPLAPGRVMPNECWLQCEAPRHGREDGFHFGDSSIVGSVRRDLHGTTRFSSSFHPSFLGFEAPSHRAASRSQAGIRESHGGSFVMYQAIVATFGVDAISVGRKHTEPPRVLDIDNTYEANRSRRCDATSFVRELHLSVSGEAACVGDRCPGVVPFDKSTAMRAVTRGIG